MQLLKQLDSAFLADAFTPRSNSGSSNSASLHLSIYNDQMADGWIILVRCWYGQRLPLVNAFALPVVCCCR